MRSFFQRSLSSLVGGFALFLLLTVACSQQPKLSRNTPEYQYAQIKKALSDLKYEKIINQSNEFISKFPDSPYADKARILRIVLLVGLGDSYKSLAEAYVDGFDKSTKNAGQLRATAYDYYRKQKNTALGIYGGCEYFLINFSENTPYVLECDFPGKDVVSNSKLDEVRKGNLLDSEQQKIAEDSEVDNGIIRALASFLGDAEDRAKARKLMESGSKPLDHAEFIVRLGRILLENQKLFGRSALNEIQPFRQFTQKASECAEIALKILKDKPNEEIQKRADSLKTELETSKKSSAKSP